MSQGLFTGRHQHRLDGQVHFAEVTVCAEPCLGESQVILSEEVLNTLRNVFGTDFEHQRHCLWAAVAAQISTINVRGTMPFAGAISFRADVVEIRVSGNPGRDLGAFLLTAAGMDAIGEYLVVWEREKRDGTYHTGDRVARPPAMNEVPSASDIAGFGPSREVEIPPPNPFEQMSEHELRCVVYQTCYSSVRADISSGSTEDEIREHFVLVAGASGARAEAVRRAVDDALAARPPSDEFRADP